MSNLAHDSPSISRPPATRPISVLVVEDDDALRGTIVELLHLDGHRVLEAPHGARALELLRRPEPVDLVLLDLWMPTMDGWTFRAQQRRDPRLRDVPVVILTTDDGPRARAIEADAFLMKPVGAENLSSTVRRVVAERRTRTKETASLVSQTLSVLAGAVSHEVANPLMALIAWLERARTHGTPPETGDEASIEDMLAQCWRIADALKTLRSLPFPDWIRERKIDLAAVVRAALVGMRDDTLKVRCRAEGELFVHGDPLVVLYVCTAVLYHAMEAFPRTMPRTAVGDEPHVDVHVTRVNGDIVLEVMDRGPPIPEEDVGRVFTVDYPGRTRAWSAGLRLWYVRQALAGLGGSVELSNRTPTGVVCKVILPAVN